MWDNPPFGFTVKTPRRLFAIRGWTSLHTNKIKLHAVTPCALTNSWDQSFFKLTTMLTLKDVPVTAVALATLLSLHGLRKKSLSPDGALTAFVVGMGTMAGGLKVFGVTLIGFYLLGSRATKCKYE